MKKEINKIKNKNIIIFSELTHLFINLNKNLVLKNILKEINILIKNKNTIILPTFNFNFHHSNKMSQKESFITTGYLNKYLLKKFKFQRTNKPIYNYAIFGPKSKELINLKQTSSFGKDSIIGYLSRNNAYGLGFGIDPGNFNWVTLHACEEEEKVPYRFYKIFRGINIENKKKVFEKIFVRKKNTNYKNDGTKIYFRLKKEKKIRSFNIKNIKVTFLNLSNYYKIGIKLLKKNKLSLVV